MILFVVVAVPVFLAGYVALCAVQPFKPCFRCYRDGASCRRCKGVGIRIRRGRRVWNYYRGKRRAAVR